MSPKIIKAEDFDLSTLLKFDRELSPKKIAGKEVQELKVPSFELNVHHAEKVRVFKDTQYEVDQMIGNAKKEAASIIESAKSETEKTRKEAFDRGYLDGQKKAADEGKSYVAEIVKNFSNMTVALARHKNEIIKESESELLKLVLEIVNKIIVTKLDEDDEIIVRVVKKAVNELADREQLTVKVNPRDAEVMKREKVSLIQELDGIKKLTIVEDESIKRGGCFIETSSSDVDARIDKQIDLIGKALTGAAPK